MGVDLRKPVRASPKQSVGDINELLRAEVVNRIYNEYCDQAVRSDLIRHAVKVLGFEPFKAQIVIDMELDALGFANEYALCNELDELLRRFTDKDKKLDIKERQDAMQMVCKSKPGTTKGLAFDVAEHRIIEFCKSNNVRVKVGLFKWAIP